MTLPPPKLEKTYIVHPPIGKCKYPISHHDGVKTHGDGSRFYCLATPRNKKERDSLIRKLESEGYRHI